MHIQIHTAQIDFFKEFLMMMTQANIIIYFELNLLSNVILIAGFSNNKSSRSSFDKTNAGGNL